MRSKVRWILSFSLTNTVTGLLPFRAVEKVRPLLDGCPLLPAATQDEGEASKAGEDACARLGNDANGEIVEFGRRSRVVVV